MSRLFTCTQGHHWEADADLDLTGHDEGTCLCPVCRSPSRPETPGPQAIPTHDQTPFIPGYEILSELGRGGMGIVYKARQLHPPRLVALKMILDARGAGPEELARFRREAEAMARLQHPNIVQIFEVGEQDGRPFFSLEFAAAGNLASQLPATPLPAAQAAPLVEMLARAVHHAHQQGVVHRDLKPANILLSPKSEIRKPKSETAADSDFGFRISDFEPKVTDFGLAKLLDREESLTETGAIVGTVSYMAPEQARGKGPIWQVGPAADVYALGAILYRLLTGRPPYEGETVLDVLTQLISRDEPVSPRRLWPRCPPDLETICLKCLEKDPGRRYGSAQALADDLARFQKKEPIWARPVGKVGRLVKWARRKPGVATLTALVLLVSAVAFGLVTWQLGQTQAALEDVRTARDDEAVQTRKAIEAGELAKKKAIEAAKSATTALEQEENATNRSYALGIAAADGEWLANNVPRALQLLQDSPRKFRNWEWRYLERRCHEELFILPHAHRVHGLAFRGDGRLLASACEDKTVTLWDPLTGRKVATLTGHPGAVRSVSFSPTGDRLASAGNNRAVKVWDVKKRKELFALAGHTSSVNCVLYDPTGKYIATGGTDATVRLWKAEDGSPVHTWKGHTRAVEGLAFTSDGGFLFSAAEDGTVKVCSVANRDLKPAAIATSKFAFFTVAVSRDNQLMAWGGEDETVTVLKASTREKFLFHGHNHNVTSVAFSRDGRFLASGGWDHGVRLWRPDGGLEMANLRGHTGFVSGVAFSPNGRLLASSAWDNTVRIWDARVRLGQESFALPGPAGKINHLTFSRDSRYLAAASIGQRLGVGAEIKVWELLGMPGRPARVLITLPQGGGSYPQVVFGKNGQVVATTARDNNTIKVLEVPAGKERFPLRGHTGRVRSLAFHADGNRLASASEDGTVKLWDVTMGKLLRTITAHKGSVTCVRFSPDNKTLATAGVDEMVRTWEVDSGKPLRHFAGKPESNPRNLVFSPDGRLLAWTGTDTMVRVWDTVRGREILRKPTDGRSTCNAIFSPDGRLLAWGSSGGYDKGEVKVWDVQARKERFTLAGHNGLIWQMTFSRDSKRLATAGGGMRNGEVKVWDVVAGQELLTFRVERAGFLSVDFSPDGNRLAAGTSASILPIWDGTPLPKKGTP